MSARWRTKPCSFTLLTMQERNRKLNSDETTLGLNVDAKNGESGSDRCGSAAKERCVLHSRAPRSEPHVDRKFAATAAAERKSG